jgi:hypothetical protein
VCNRTTKNNKLTKESDAHPESYSESGKLTFGSVADGKFTEGGVIVGSLTVGKMEVNDGITFVAPRAC